MSVEFIEPWQPQPGQRVQIRLNGECGLTGPKDSPAGDLGRVGHDLAEDGRTGVVVDGWTNPHTDAQGHRYRVRRDGPQIGGYRAGVYAAIELLPLDGSR